MNRIETLFFELADENRPALVPFIMGGDPNLSTTAELLKALPKAGADMIEIGIPFSDPMADGPIIAAAGKRAIKAGATLEKILKLVKDFRTYNQNTPIILMGYYNPIYRMGDEKFCKLAAAAGVDGLIIVDVPPEEEKTIRPLLKKNKIDLIRLIAPTTSDNRLKTIVKSASGFVYYVAVSGVTGVKSANFKSLKRQIEHARYFVSLPIAVGFGIKTPEQATEVGMFADAVVVGSALVDLISQKKERKAAVNAASRFVRELAAAVRYD